MQNRDVDPHDPVSVAQPFGDLVLRSPPNWTAVGFFGMLGALHLMISIPTLIGGRWEGYLSLAFGTIFVFVSGLCTQCRYEMAVLGSKRRVRLRSGAGRFCLERTHPLLGHPRRPPDPLRPAALPRVEDRAALPAGRRRLPPHPHPAARRPCSSRWR